MNAGYIFKSNLTGDKYKQNLIIMTIMRIIIIMIIIIKKSYQLNYTYLINILRTKSALLSLFHSDNVREDDEHAFATD